MSYTLNISFTSEVGILKYAENLLETRLQYVELNTEQP